MCRNPTQRCQSANGSHCVRRRGPIPLCNDEDCILFDGIQVFGLCACPAQQYGGGPGGSACTACPTEVGRGGAAACQCPANFFRSGGVCGACPATSPQGASGGASCVTPCFKGQYLPPVCGRGFCAGRRDGVCAVPPRNAIARAVRRRARGVHAVPRGLRGAAKHHDGVAHCVPGTYSATLGPEQARSPGSCVACPSGAFSAARGAGNVRAVCPRSLRASSRVDTLRSLRPRPLSRRHRQRPRRRLHQVSRRYALQHLRRCQQQRVQPVRTRHRVGGRQRFAFRLCWRVRGQAIWAPRELLGMSP